jgi:cytochrome c5
MMKYATPFTIVASAIFLLACGKSEDVPAPATQPPVAETTEAEPAPPVSVDPAAQAVEPMPADVTTSTQPEVAPAQPAPASKPEAAVPAKTSPAETAAVAPSAEMVHGEKIYRQACAFCHDKGLAGAPKIGDAAAWGPRLAQGMDVLYTVSLRGKGAMPAKGGNPALSEADVKAAVDYMVAQSR